MQITERKRKYGQGKTAVKTKKKLPINFDVSSLDLMCQYTISSNRNIKRGMYINLRNLIEVLDMEKYINDQERYKRVLFIKKGLEGRLERGLDKPQMLVKYVNGGFVDDNFIDVSNYTELSNQEIDWINETISNTLSLLFLYEEADRGIDLLTRFKIADSSNITRIGMELKDWVSKLNTMFRRVQAQSVINETFSLDPAHLVNMLDSVRTELTNEYRKLYTGMVGFNQLIGGGFENTRCYLFLGITGIGKSLSLMNIATQIKKYNKNFKPKDPTKIPTIVYLTMENTVVESVDRLFSISTGLDIRNFSTEEAVEILKRDGELYLSDESPINLLIKYQPNRSVDTGYLYTLTEDLEDEGYEVICMIQDHVKRIRAASGQTDTRLELGDVINEMKTFAILKDIPIITVSHLNRDAAKIIDTAPTRSNKDIVRLLGKSNVGESMLMLDNVDYSGIIHVEYDQNGNKFMSFKNIKQRIGCKRDCIYQPFDINNEIKLVEDFYEPLPLFKETLYETPPLERKPVVTEDAVNYDDDTDNVFEFANRYSSVNLSTLQDKPVRILSYSDIEREEQERKELERRFPTQQKKKLFTHVA